jgi:hypothetical protein
VVPVAQTWADWIFNLISAFPDGSLTLMPIAAAIELLIALTSTEFGEATVTFSKVKLFQGSFT